MIMHGILAAGLQVLHGISPTAAMQLMNGDGYRTADSPRRTLLRSLSEINIDN